MQLDLFKPEPMIPAAENISGRDVYYCAERCVWTVEPEFFQCELCALTAERKKREAQR